MPEVGFQEAGLNGRSTDAPHARGVPQFHNSSCKSIGTTIGQSVSPQCNTAVDCSPEDCLDALPRRVRRPAEKPVLSFEEALKETVGGEEAANLTVPAQLAAG